MSYCTLETYVLPDIMGKKRYDDVGLLNSSYAVKHLAFKSSNSIIDELKSYKSYLDSIGLPVMILLNMDFKKLFFLDEVYFKFKTYEGTLEVSLNLKEGLPYKYVERKLKDGNLTERQIALYEGYWANALYCVFLEAKMDCDEFVRSKKNV